MLRSAVALALMIGLAASARADAPPGTFDVPRDRGPQRVTVLTREFGPGQGPEWHVHAGAEITQVIEGRMLLEIAGEPGQVLTPGDVAVVPRGVPHKGVNIGQGNAKVAIAYVLDRDAPLRVTVPAPRGR